MKILIDAFGGDNSPQAQVQGGIDFINAQQGADIVFTGDEQKLKAELDKLTFDRNRVSIVHAPDVVTNEDSPTGAIRAKKESSLVKAFDVLKSDESVAAMVSSGSTGAVLTGAVLKVGRIPGVLRPALCPLLPTKTGGRVCIVDCGANMDCRPEYLRQFALMGVSYMRSVCGIQNPRVGLLSVGVEDHKGNELTKAVFAMLEELPINFAGNMEARDALTGEYDVIVTDGFAGNVLLKSVEGTAQMVMSMLKQAIMQSASAKFGTLFMKKAFSSLKSSMDYQQFGGAPFLGVEKVIVKAHGASNPKAITAALFQAESMAKSDLCGQIKAEVEKLATVEEGAAQ
ncbi:MAG: phosphate acyltransferase PlsX [Clostridia bacterium]|nr:phosphate acyltransferase PlsX [Clostridia bacterium]